MPKLTKRTIDALRPGSTDVFAWDNELRGFGVRMKPSGSASWLVQYRNAEGRTRRLVLGKIGTLTPDKAREIARDKLTDAAHGKDPSAERHAAREAITVAELCDLYIEEAEATGRIKQSTLAMDRSRIERHVKPLIGNRAVRSLTPADVAKMQIGIAAGKTATPRADKGRGGRTTGGRGVASRTVGMLATILELAKRKRVIRDNPAREVEKIPEGKQRRFLSFDEIGALGQVMRDAFAAGESAIGVAAVTFLLLTGCRRMEALALRWDVVDSRARCLRFRDTKSGPQLRPIGTAVLALLEKLPRREGCDYVFPGEREGDAHFVGLPRVLARLCQRAKLAPGVTIHVLRHSFAASAAELGFSELTIAGLLGHSVPGVTARYAHIPDRALVAAADQVAAYVSAALDGTAATAEIVQLASRR